ADTDALLAMSPEQRARPPAEPINPEKAMELLGWKARNWCTVLRTRTTVSVQWQDGNTSHNIASTELVPLNHVGDSDFFPNDFVVRRKLAFEDHDDADLEEDGEAAEEDAGTETERDKLLQKLEVGIV